MTAGLSSTYQMFYMWKIRKKLYFLKIQHVKNRCVRVVLPAIISFKGIWLQAIVHNKVTQTHTLVLPVLPMYVSMNVVLSLLSRMHSCDLLVFFTTQWCEVGLGHRKWMRPCSRSVPRPIASWAPMQLQHLCIYTQSHTWMHHKAYKETCYDTTVLRSIW